MSDSFLDLERWEFGVLDIHHPETCTLREYFKLIPNLEKVPGEVVELGVARGRSLITTGLILENLKSPKSVIGLDSFEGFPKYSSEDEFNNFNDLRNANLISEEHYNRVLKNAAHVKARGADVHPSQISSSQDFSNTSIHYVQSRIDYLGLQSRVKIQVGDFTLNIEKLIEGQTLSLVLLDSDLYGSYAMTLPTLWRQLSPGGYIYLDEYYSLKFPGPRIAVNKFMTTISDGNLVKLEPWMDFERWAIVKID
jgi:Macrocin-O-methyltransferase (TylF)